LCVRTIIKPLCGRVTSAIPAEHRGQRPFYYFEISTSSCELFFSGQCFVLWILLLLRTDTKELSIAAWPLRENFSACRAVLISLKAIVPSVNDDTLFTYLLLLFYTDWTCVWRISRCLCFPCEKKKKGMVGPPSFRPRCRRKRN